MSDTDRGQRSSGDRHQQDAGPGGVEHTREAEGGSSAQPRLSDVIASREAYRPRSESPTEASKWIQSWRKFWSTDKAEKGRLYRDVLEGDPVKKLSKQERFQTIRKQAVLANNYIASHYENHLGEKIDGKTPNELDEKKWELLDRIRASEQSAWKDNSGKEQKYRAELDARNAARELQEMAEQLRRYHEECPAVEKVKEGYRRAEALPPVDREERTTTFKELYDDPPSVIVDGDEVEIQIKVKEDKLKEGESNKVCYRNQVYPNEGRIVNDSNDREEDKSRRLRKEEIDNFHHDDIMWQNWRIALERKGLDINTYKPVIIEQLAVSEKDTVSRLRGGFGTGDDEKDRNANLDKAFIEGTKGYYEVLATRGGRNKIFFLTRYFPDLEISRIDVQWRNVSGSIDSITYHLAEKSRQAPTISKGEQWKLPEKPRRMLIE